MSRFFRGGSDSDSSSSSSDSSYHSEDEVVAPTPATRFARNAYSSDSESEEDVKRVVRSAKDKRFDLLRGHVAAINSGLKTDDWMRILSEFDASNRLITKFGPSFLTGGKPPAFYLRCLVALEDALGDGADARKKGNAQQGKAFNTMKQRARKNNKPYEADIAAFRANPVVSSAEESAEESDSEDEAPAAPVAPVKAKPARAPKASDDDSDSWPSDSDMSSDESSDDDGPSQGINRWLKKDTSAAAKTPAPAGKKTKKPKESAAREAPAADDDDGFTKVGAKGKVVKEERIIAEDIPKHLQTLSAARGKRSTNQRAMVKLANQLLAVASTPADIARVLLASIALRLDQRVGTNAMLPFDAWNFAVINLGRLLTLLEENPNLKVYEQAADGSEADPMATEVQGSIVSLVERVDDEFFRTLQAIDPHTTDYLRRLKNQTALYVLIARSQMYFESRQLTDSVSRAVMRRVDHLYYKPDQVATVLEQRLRESAGPGLRSTIVDYQAPIDPSTLVHHLCAYLYRHGDSVLRTRAILCHIYHHALHDRFHAARDLLLMSHLQETIHLAEISVQVLYNRALVQLGLCAFRQGFVKEAFAALQEICGSGRQKELLAQGVHNQRKGPVDPDQEFLERQRQLPFHMHINLELLECVYLTSCLLLEIPAMARAGGANNPDARKRIISKVFRRLMDYHERQIFTGPPENTRDHILSAARALAVGNWEKCDRLMRAIKIWDLLPEGGDRIRDMLTVKIKEEGLRTYLFTYAPFYETLSLPMLATMFDVPLPVAYRIIAKMIWHEELVASLDRVGELVVFHGVDPTRVQQLALTFADKVGHLVDNNEKLFDQKVATFQKEQGEGGDGEDDESQDRQGGGRSQRGGGRFRGGDRRGGRGGSRFGGNDRRGDRGQRSGGGDYNNRRQNGEGGRSYGQNRRGGYQGSRAQAI
ncbi:Translation initiation factor 3 subunit c [Tieghemiomyces parasiticus]|uniref:Eukaryotic translation initiation factor 3 subunit C n=1 Tax=Tieghemiomyces parasiticus TaxID=78921 RepID=A0A9W8DU20_9FUNG|nr:Translation initiation factor 3 subunit c [Tieghemiomyces parasiticus]